jgi:transcription-repair coupling factor (superfamily II helicase)
MILNEFGSFYLNVSAVFADTHNRLVYFDVDTESLYRYPYGQFRDAMSSAESIVHAYGLAGVFARHVFARLVGDGRRNACVIVPDEAESINWASDLRFFLSKTHTVLEMPVFDSAYVSHVGSQRQTVMRLNGVLAQCVWSEKPVVLVATAAAMQRKVMPRPSFDARTQIIAVEESLDRDELAAQLVEAGYLAVPTVEDTGTFALRGSICDVFPVGVESPYRIELWGDEIESITLFNPSTQRGLGIEVDSVLIPPLREESFTKSAQTRAKREILAAAGKAGIPTRKLQPLLDDLMNGVPFVGMEALRSFFYDTLDSVFSYLKAGTLCCWVDPLGCQQVWQEQLAKTVHHYERSLENSELVAVPDRDYVSASEAEQLIGQLAHARFHVLDLDSHPSVPGIRFQTPQLSMLKTAFQDALNLREPLKPLLDFLRECKSSTRKVMMVCSQRLQKERLERVCKNFGLACTSSSAYAASSLDDSWAVQLVDGTIAGSTVLLDTHTVILSDVDIFGHKIRRRAKSKSAGDSPFVQDFRELKEGDYVVHADHGIGLYVGLKKLAVVGHESDFLVVAFAGQDKLYLPVYKLGRLQKYSGGAGNPRVTKLGGTSWETVKAKARASAEEDALALLDLYARRELAAGFAFSEPNEYFRAFENSFPFEETEDQARSIDEVLADMGRPRPMDRLLCGDVGFGKTEVALRATMRAVLDGKQVCLLVPTTVLALQHFKTFRARFAEYPVEIGLFSRLVNSTEMKTNIEALRNGKLDVAIGTHKLLSKDIEFNDLGLLVLDEEHRFGVKHKDRIKDIRSNVDVLAMTATPIPRTLQMSLAGIRDLSVIQTAPAERKSVRTFVCRRTDDVVTDAIRRELGRGGQVFFVHNRVQSIEAKAAWLKSLVPEARIVIGHGQMPPEKLEQVMLEFTNGIHNVLLATTIIESGIDIPTANTMLIDQADNFGLAQLYQLRGRVGRSRDRAYCYLLVPSELVLHKEAKSRLATIQQFTELGSGFHVASFDLEQRGAGELLGTRQKGQVQSVGIDLYSELLDDAIRTLRGQAPKVAFDPELKFALNARIPEDYIDADTLRLRFYKRLSNANDEETVLSLQDELIERFGALPGSVVNLVELMRIRCLAKQLGLALVEHSHSGLTLTFDPRTPVVAPIIFDLIQHGGSHFSVPANYKLRYDFSTQESANSLASSRGCLQRIVDRITDDCSES